MDLEIDLVPSKKELRKEKKKRKLIALAQLVQMNDNDRIRESSGRTAETEPQRKRVKMLSANGTANGNANGIATAHAARVINDHGHDSVDKHADDKKDTSTANAPASVNKSAAAAAAAAAAAESDRSTRLAPLSDYDYTMLKGQLHARKRQLADTPVLQLRGFGERASLDTPQEQRIPIFLTDIQHLLMSALIGKESPCTPDRWCILDNPTQISHSVVLILEGLSLYHYLANESRFENANKIFDTRLEVVLPPTKDGMIMEHMAQVPLTCVQAEQLIDEYGSLRSAIELTKDPTLLVKSIFPIEDEAIDFDNDLPAGDQFPRTKLLLSALQMVEEGYPMPLRGELSERYKDFVFSKEKYAPVTNRSPMFGVDCEMCRTTAGWNELTRISIVNEQLQTIYETLVMPSNRIVNYLTPFSGITADIMKTVTKKLSEVQQEVRALLPADAILIGQSLNSDLNAMQMMHPYVIDTSVCFNMTGDRRRKSKLQALALTFLKESIQANDDGHDSVEDSVASLKLVQMKLANSIEFGDVILLEQRRYQEMITAINGKNIKNNLFAHATQWQKRTAIVSAGTIQAPVKAIIEKAVEAAPVDGVNAVSLYEFESSSKAIKKAQEVAHDHSLTIANLQLAEKNLQQADAVERFVTKLDKWIEQLWGMVAHNGMFLVLMGGSAECPSGLAKIAFKKDTNDRRFCQIRWPGDAAHDMDGAMNGAMNGSMNGGMNGMNGMNGTTGGTDQTTN